MMFIDVPLTNKTTEHIYVVLFYTTMTGNNKSRSNRIQCIIHTGTVGKSVIKICATSALGKATLLL